MGHLEYSAKTGRKSLGKLWFAIGLEIVLGGENLKSLMPHYVKSFYKEKGTTTMHLSFNIAGFKHHTGPSILHTPLGPGIHTGDTVQLVKEPDNSYDPNAVKILFNGEMLGYVPARHAPSIPSNMGAVISNVDTDAEPWNAVRVDVDVEV